MAPDKATIPGYLEEACGYVLWMAVLKGDALGIGHPAILKMQVFAAVITERE